MTSVTKDLYSDEDIWLEVSCPPINWADAVAEFQIYVPRRSPLAPRIGEGRAVVNSMEPASPFAGNAEVFIAEDNPAYLVITFDTQSPKPIQIMKRASEFMVGYEGSGADDEPHMFDFSGDGSSEILSLGHCPGD